MTWQVEYLPDALKDLKNLDRTQQVKALKAIKKVSSNLLPSTEGGYGKPLGNRHGYALTGLLKVKLRKEGIRIVYKLSISQNIMKIIIIGMRTDDEVYQTAYKRKRLI